MIAKSGHRKGVRLTEARPGRRTTACGLVLAAATLACGDSGGSSSPDASSPSTDEPSGIRAITIETFPFAALLAFQDGDGRWKQLQETNGTYSALVTGPRYSVAAICRLTFDRISLSSVDLYYLSVSDTVHLQVPACLGTRPRVHASVQLQGVPSGQQGEVYLGGTLAQQTTDDSFEASLVQGEPVDVLISAIDASNVPRRVYRGPALDALADQMAEYDLSVLGAPLDSYPLTVNGLDPTERVEVRSLLNTRPSQAAWFVDYRPFSTTPPDHFSSVPVAAGRQPDDTTMVRVGVVPTQVSGDGRSYARFATVGMKTPAPTAVVLPAPWSIDGPTLEDTTLRRATLTLPAASVGQDAVDYYAQLLADGDSDGASWNLTIGAGWMDGRGEAMVTTPDLSGLVSGPPLIALPLDRDVYWALSRVERNVGFRVAAADGMRVFANEIFGVIHPPAPSP